MPRALNPIHYSDDDLTPLPATPSPLPRRSVTTGDNVSIAIMIEKGPKTYRSALNVEHALKWKDAIGKEVESRESHEVSTFVEKVP